MSPYYVLGFGITAGRTWGAKFRIHEAPAALGLKETVTGSWLPRDSACFRGALEQQNWLSPHLSIPVTSDCGSVWQHLCVCLCLYGVMLCMILHEAEPALQGALWNRDKWHRQWFSFQPLQLPVVYSDHMSNTDEAGFRGEGTGGSEVPSTPLWMPWAPAPLPGLWSMLGRFVPLR